MQEEQWQAYDAQGRVVPNKGIKPNEGYAQAALHGAAHVWLWRRGQQGIEVLLQKRSAQKWTWPNCFDISAAGHIDLGEEPLTAAIRETREEIGLEVAQTDLELIMVHRRKMPAGNGRTENEFCWVYLLELTAAYDFTLQQEEVAGLEWKPLSDFRTEVLEQHSDNYVPHGDGYFTAVFEAIERYASHVD